MVVHMEWITYKTVKHFLYAFIAACPDVEGYKSFLGMDHWGDDSNLGNGTFQTNVTLLAEQCSKEEKCNAFTFNYIISPSYLKSYSGEPSMNPDQKFRHGCYYKRITTRNVKNMKNVNNKRNSNNNNKKNIKRNMKGRREIN